LLWASVGAMPPLPERLSQTGLYLPGTQTVDSRNHPYSPQYPLWTDGAAKSRWIRLPAGARIDARNPEAWMFPVGTVFWKEFSFGGRRVETRMMRRTADGQWSYASYVWNDAQTDAVLAPDSGQPGVAEVVPGKRHDVPGREDCRGCHENRATPVLGFTALQLSDDRDPAAPHAEPLQPEMLTLRRLMTDGTLAGAPAAMATHAPRIPGDGPARAALGYLTANCGHCHNEQSPVATVRFPLLASGFETPAQTNDSVRRLLARVTDWDLPGREPGRSSLITPGAPDLSVLLVRMRSRRPSSQMPPLGTVVPDRAGLDLITAWITSLK
jgi:hypothetical protein